MRSVLLSRSTDRIDPAALDRSRALPGEDRPAVVNAAKWRAALPENCWPRRFPTDGHVWRRDVFDVADKWRAGRAGERHLLAAVLMWLADGSTTARRHALRTLADDPFGHRTAQGLAPLREDHVCSADLRQAYLAFRTDCRLPWFDGDAVTALLYFAGYRRGALHIQPLIINATIASRIPAAAGVTTAANRGSSLEWVRYLNWAAAQAGDEVEPELVEMDLARDGLRYGAADQPRPLIPRQRRAGNRFHGSRGMRDNPSVTSASRNTAAIPSNQ